MKKLLLTIAVLLAGTGLSAQPKSFGVRVGPGLFMSYQHTLDHQNFLQVDAGVYGKTDYPGWRISGNYNFTIVRHSVFSGYVDVYAGPGISMGLYDNAKFVCGVNAQVGVSYDFGRIPLNIAFDLAPSVNLPGASDFFETLFPYISIKWRL